MADAATQARELIRIVCDDTRLPLRVRQDAGKLTVLATSNSHLALERLGGLNKATVPYLPLFPPATDYARFLCVEFF